MLMVFKFVSFSFSLSENMFSYNKSPRNYGKIDIGKGKIIQFEFASVNPTGPLTIAHGRQAVMGDVIGYI